MFRSPASGVSAAAGYNGLPPTVAENVMPIEKIKWSDAVVNKFQVLVIPLLSLIAGCTNMAGDVARTIHPAPSSALDENTLFSVASEFTNPDVTAFCEYLQAQAVGSCRLLTEHGSARGPE